MLDYLAEKVVSVKRVVAIHVQVLPDNQREYSFVIVEREKQVISLLRKEHNVALDKLTREIDESIPVVLVIDGRGIVHRKSERKEGQTARDLLSSIFPQSRPEEFFMQCTESGNSVFTSVARLGLVREIIEGLHPLNSQVVKVCQGPFVVSALIRLLGKASDVIHTGSSEVHTVDGAITSVLPSPGGVRVYAIGDEQVESHFLAPYAAAIAFFLRSDLQKDINVPSDLLGRMDEWKQKRLFFAGLKYCLGSFLLLLLINAFLFLYFTRENEKLAADSGYSKTALEELVKLKEEVKKNRAFISSAGWDKPTPSWFYADRVAATLDKSDVQLIDLFVHPIDDRKFKDERKSVFLYSVIHVQGKCAKPSSLNDWLEVVRKLDWVADIKKQAYQYSEREKTGVFSFDIMIKE
jgi:hypothetical protein